MNGEQYVFDEYRYKYNSNQNINGNGFFSVYKNTIAKDLELIEQSHGSGSYDYESRTFGSNRADYDESGEWGYFRAEQSINMNETADFSYSPISMKLGKYLLPINYESKGMEKTTLKNYASGVSMNAEFYDENKLNKILSTKLASKLANDTANPSAGVFQNYLEIKASTELNVDAAFSGRGHIGVLNANRSLRNSDILIDEDYSGDFTIVKKISHHVTTKLIQLPDDWLPCCSNGFLEMNYLDQKPFTSAKGVFDCTCSLPPGTIK